MKYSKLIISLAVLFASIHAHAITINDTGVVGIFIQNGSENANVDNVTNWANYLLSLGADTSDTFDANGDGTTEDYQTSSVDYNGFVSDGIRTNGATADVSSYEWVVGKYDGLNAGYVMFNVSDYLGTYSGSTIPEYSFSIWGENDSQYQLSNITGYGTNPSPTPTPTPDSGATIALMGIALAGLGFLKRRR